MLDKLTVDFINKIILEFNKPDNKTKLTQEIINPIFLIFANKMYPYVSLLFIMYSINLVLIIVILILIIINKKKS